MLRNPPLDSVDAVPGYPELLFVIEGVALPGYPVELEGGLEEDGGKGSGRWKLFEDSAGEEISCQHRHFFPSLF